MWAATTIAKEFLSFFNLIWNFFYFWDEICHACLSLSLTVLNFLSKYVQSQMHQLLSWRFSFPGLYNTPRFHAVIFSCFGLRRTKRREVYLSLFEKKNNSPNKHTLFSWIRLLCVAEIRFFSNWSFAFKLLQVWMADDEQRQQQLTTSGGKLF